MRLKEEVRKHSPFIFATLGVAGFITATVMSARATPKAVKILEDYPDDAPKIEKARALAPVYAPTAGMILLSTACIVFSNRIHTYRYASLLALYSVGERTLQRWQDAVVEEVGKGKFEKVRQRTTEPRDDIPGSMVVEEGEVVLYDNYTGRFFKADSVETIRRKANDLTDRMFSGDWISLNDWYYEIGLPNTEFGDEIGWDAAGGPINMTFDAFLKNDRPVISVSFNVKPRKF